MASVSSTGESSSISDFSSMVMASVSSTGESSSISVLDSMSTPSNALPRTPASTLLSSSSSPVVEVGLCTLNGSLPLVLDHELAGFGKVGHCIRDGVDQQIALAFDHQLLSMLKAIYRYRYHG